MRILVTGGLGAVGAPLAERLRQAGHEVWVLDRAHHHGVRGTYYYRCDVGEYRQVERVFDEVRFDFVYHAAAEFGRINGEDFYETLWRTNAVGTKNLIRLQEKQRFRMVIFSSSEIYGDYQGEMHEDVPDQYPIQQLNDYAVSKWVNELQVRNSAALHGTETVTMRVDISHRPRVRIAAVITASTMF
jgi:dTDP-glucose 4,6-dehydratase